MESNLRYLKVAWCFTAFAVLPLAPRAETVTIPLKGPAQIADLYAHGIEILAQTKYGLDVWAEGPALDYLRSRPYPISIHVEKAGQTHAILDENLGQYHTYAETEQMLFDLAFSYPAIAQRSVIGTSLQGRNITMLKISDNVTADESEPEVLYMGNHHARELMSVEIPLLFANYLLQNYITNPMVAQYVNTREIYVIPMVNPDGHFYVQQNHAGSPGTWWRKNRFPTRSGRTSIPTPAASVEPRRSRRSRRC